MSILLENATEDGEGPEIDWNGNHGGEFQLFGVFNGATVTVKGSLDGGETYTEPPGNIGRFTSETFEPLDLHVPCKLQATISDAGPSTDLTALVKP